MEIKRFSRPVCKVVRDEIKEALGEVAKKYNIEFVVKSGTFTAFDFRVRVEGFVKTEEAKKEIEDNRKEMFRYYCRLHGLAPDVWGKVITLADGKEYRITDIFGRSAKYPIQITRLPDLKQFKASARIVQQALKANL